MSNISHEFSVTVDWNGGRDGSGVASFGNGVKTPITVPESMNGQGGTGNTNPEELLTAALASCYAITFGIVTANRKLPVLGVTVPTVGNVVKGSGGLVFSSVTMRPQITVSADATEEQLASVMDMAYKSEGYCLISAAVRDKVELTVEPTIVKV